MHQSLLAFAVSIKYPRMPSPESSAAVKDLADKWLEWDNVLKLYLRHQSSPFDSLQMIRTRKYRNYWPTLTGTRYRH